MVRFTKYAAGPGDQPNREDLCLVSTNSALARQPACRIVATSVPSCPPPGREECPISERLANVIEAMADPEPSIHGDRSRLWTDDLVVHDAAHGPRSVLGNPEEEAGACACLGEGGARPGLPHR